MDRVLQYGAMSPEEAIETLGLSPRKLAISADGAPLAVPADDAAYLKAMRANVKGAQAATEVQFDQGGPRGSLLSNKVDEGRTDELETLDELRG